MNSKKWTTFFVALLSFNYATALVLDALGLGGGGGAKAGGKAGISGGIGGGIGGSIGLDIDGGLLGDITGSVGAILGGGAGGASNFSGWSETCGCNEELEAELDGCLDNIRNNIKKGFSLGDSPVEGTEYQLQDGSASGFHKFERKGPYRCKVERKFARIYFQIGFVRLVFSYLISAAEGFVGNVFGDLASVAADILADLGDTACKLGFPDIVVNVILKQNFDGSDGIEVEEFSLGALGGMTFLDDGGPLQAAADVLTPIFYPAFQLIVSTVMQGDVQSTFQEEFKNVRAERYMFSDADLDDDDGDMGGRGRGRGGGSISVRGGGGTGGRGGGSIRGGGSGSIRGGGSGSIRGGGSGRGEGSISGSGGGRGSGSVSMRGGGGAGFGGSISGGAGFGGGGRRGGRTEFSSSSSGSSSSKSDSSNVGSKVYYSWEEDYED